VLSAIQDPESLTLPASIFTLFALKKRAYGCVESFFWGWRT